MKLQDYRAWVDITDVTSKNDLLARLAERLDEMNKWADMDWSMVELATEEDYIDEMTFADVSPRVSMSRNINITVPGLPDPVDGEGVEAGPV